MRSLLLASLLLLSGASQAQDPVGDLVKKRMAETKSPGATVAVIKDGTATITAYGLADIENSVPAKADTVYEIGSVTKQFTATAVMMLVEQGKVKLDESVLTYLPDLPQAWKGATIKHLLNHTSGIPSYTGVEEFGEFMLKPGAQKDLLKIVVDKPVDFAPGEKWQYNNTGYYLLGLLIEKITGKSYREAMKEMIFSPLGMTATDLYSQHEIVPNRARGYQLYQGKLMNAQYIDMTWPYSAGSIMSTVPDLVKWDAAQGSTKLLKEESWKQMWTPTILNDKSTTPYGFGWGLGKVPGSAVIEHNGGIPGFSSQINRYPDKKVTVIVLTNLIGPMVGGLTKEIAGVVDASLAEEKLKAVEDKDPALTARLRKVFDAALAGEADKNDFDAKMQELLWPDRIKGLNSQLGQFGPLKSFTLLSAAEDGDGKKRVYLGDLGAVKLRITFGIDKAGKINGFLIQPAE